MTELIKEKLYAIVVPEIASKPYISNTNFVCYYTPYGYREIAYFEQLEGDFKILGTATKDTIDFDCEPCVESIEVSEYKYGGELHPKDMFLDYTTNTYWLESYEESFRSLIESKGLYFVNPYGDMEPEHIYSDSPNKNTSRMYQDRLNKWQQAENNLIQKLLIIQKL